MSKKNRSRFFEDFAQYDDIVIIHNQTFFFKGLALTLGDGGQGGRGLCRQVRDA